MVVREPVVLRLPRLDHDDEEPDFILLHVSTAGSNPLDLKLIGTENSTLFSVSLRHKQTSKLKDKKLNQEEWEAILLSLLLGTDAEGTPVAVANGLEAVAKVDGDSSMTITIQKNTEGITQKLGTITLSADEDANGDLYEWCGLTIQGKDELRNELQASKLKLDEKDAQIKKLEDSLAELTKLKNENDTQLLEKFSLLLNEKKLRIRDQQRLLQSSTVDPAAAQAMEETRLESRSRSAGPSRGGKRKASQEEDDESDDGFEKMDVDDQTAANESDQEEQDQDESTADEATASEDDEDGEPPSPPPTRKSTSAKPAGSSQTLASRDRSQPEEPPPKRELPFARKPAAAPAKAPAPVPEGSETESDDEL